MVQRVAEHVVRGGLFRPKRLLRVDLHGVSTFSAGNERTLIRWEWIEAIHVEPTSVTVRSSQVEITLPEGSFGLSPDVLATELEKARDIRRRPDAIGRLSSTDVADKAGR